MGRRKWSAPRRGSLAFSPRSRASSWTAKVKAWPEYDGDPRPLAFAGYKAGMVQVVALDNRKGSLTFGKEVVVPATVVEAPPMLVCGLRAYHETMEGLKVLTEAWMEDPPEGLERLVTIPDKFDMGSKLEEMESKLDQISDIRLLLMTQPKLAKRERKKPELLEVKVGGGSSIRERFEYAKSLLGKEVKASDVFQEGQWVDAIAVTKGKGFQGPVKRWGVAKLHHKSRKTVRGVGSIGPWTPSFVMRTVPRAGQMGFHRRTEYNKQILAVGGDGGDVTPKGGFIKYGEVNGSYLLLKGSIPGPKKRLITLRYAMRPPGPPQPLYRIEEVNLESQQGK
ncbi:MAG: 50S ribosomal protein L3 [Candidatus Bathyarchaeia archaeon]|nr:50S ribosomal protein L3 [Candidatus Bathyarchaeota archaeon]